MKPKKIFTVGDGTLVLSPAEVQALGITFFDELENDCWELFKGYCDALGIQVVNDKEHEDFFIAKQIQEKVFDIIQESGIKINFGSNGSINETEETGMSL